MATLYQLMVSLTLDFVHQSSLLNTTVIPPLTIAIVLLMVYQYCLVLTVVVSVSTQMSYMEHIHTTANSLDRSESAFQQEVEVLERPLVGVTFKATQNLD